MIEVVDLRPMTLVSEDREDAFVRNSMIGRAMKLERMGLAEQIAPGRWRLDESMEPTLKRLGLRGDIIKTMHAEMARQGIEHGLADYRIHDASDKAAPTLVGRVIGKGLSDELNDRHYLIVDAVDGQTYYVDIGTDQHFGVYREGMIVEVGRPQTQPRGADKTVAAVAAHSGGVYSAEHHREFDPRASARWIQTHIRRLEALERAGVVQQTDEQTWAISEDHLTRVTLHEEGQRRWRPVAVTVQSYWALDKQIDVNGGTWLDRQLTAKTPLPLSNTGFGRDVAERLEARRRWLVSQHWGGGAGRDDPLLGKHGGDPKADGGECDGRAVRRRTR